MGWLASGDPLEGRWCYVCREVDSRPFQLASDSPASSASVSVSICVKELKRLSTEYERTNLMHSFHPPNAATRDRVNDLNLNECSNYTGLSMIYRHEAKGQVLSGTELILFHDSHFKEN